MRNLQIAHTPTPWQVTPRGEILATSYDNPAPRFEVIATMTWPRSDLAAENAGFIVKARNAHYELVQALRKARTHVRYRAWSSDEEKKECDVLAPYLDAVLAKLEGAK